MKILLVAGHGDGDPGACSNGYKEADLARNFVSLLSAYIKQYAIVDIFDTTKNMYRYLKNGDTFNFSPYDHVLEIHFNSGGGTGTEILAHTNQQDVSVEQNIVNDIEKLGITNRGVKRRSNLGTMNRLFKLKKRYSLLEICFIDSISDMNFYLQNAEQIAEAVSESIRMSYDIPEPVKKLTSVNDIVWELSQRDIITNKDLWLKRLEQDTNEYWLARKSVNYIGQHFRNDIKFDSDRDNGLITPNDIIWELAERNIITNKQLWFAKLQEYGNAYWLARKIANYVRFL